MKLHVLGSSSSGNCYLIQNDKECLIIEAGVNIKEVKKALDFDISKVFGCLVSHSHGDHAGHFLAFSQSGIKIFAHESVIKENKHHNLIKIQAGKQFDVGTFRVMPFELPHDVPCLGFYIHHPETGVFCFITDTNDVPLNFKGLNNIMVECNYDSNIIDNNDTSYFLRDRIILSHLSFEKCNDFLSTNDLSQVNNIVLLHASDSNSDVGAFKDTLKQNYHKEVFIASKGLVIDFNSKPF